MALSLFSAGGADFGECQLDRDDGSGGLGARRRV